MQIVTKMSVQLTSWLIGSGGNDDKTLMQLKIEYALTSHVGLGNL
jgi:hypothetical protein